MSSRPIYLAVIPARKGSKTLPGKNKRLLCGRPLIQYTVEAAQAAVGLADVVVSTDDQEIARWAQRHGLTVLGLRDPELAQDDTPIKPVLQYELKRWEQYSRRKADAVVLLQPTSPLRTKDDIEGALSLFEYHPECDSVVSVVRVPHRFLPLKILVRDDDGRVRPWQEGSWPHEGTSRNAFANRFWARNGPAVLITRRTTLMDKDSLYGTIVMGYEMPQSRSVDIDDEDDWMLAELILGKNTAA